jgi:YtkA-like protein
MNLKSMLAVAVYAGAMSLNGAVFAGANDYVFEAVKPGVKKGNGVTVAVRLVNKATHKPVPDAVIVASRIDMSPEGMGTMTAPLTPVAGADSGTYGFRTDLPMAGGWLLTLSAKVQGEAETVTGKVTFKATD